MRPSAASVCGLKLPVYAALSYQCMRPYARMSSSLSRRQAIHFRNIQIPSVITSIFLFFPFCNRCVLSERKHGIENPEIAKIPKIKFLLSPSPSPAPSPSPSCCPLSRRQEIQHFGNTEIHASPHWSHPNQRSGLHFTEIAKIPKLKFLLSPSP